MASPSTPSTARCFALVPCAGVGARSGADRPKQYVSVAGQPLVVHTLQALSRVQALAGTLLVLAPQDPYYAAEVAPAVAALARPVWPVPCGGDSRAQSVLQGLAALVERGGREDDWVLVHDAARCLLRPSWVERLIHACQDDPVGGLLALPVADTLKSGEGGRVAATVERSSKWAAQTPQMFRLGILQRALRSAGTAVTDESSAVEALGMRPRLVEGALENFKVTYPHDFELASLLLGHRDNESGGVR